MSFLSSKSCNRPWQISRAQGCLLGYVCGDALGSEVASYLSPEEIRKSFPCGVREMQDGGAFNTLAGQPTDVSEMAIALARLIVKTGRYDPIEVKSIYQRWFNSGPFDCNETIASALCGKLDRQSQGNGALMRASPLGLFGAGHDLEVLADWARMDTALTHPNSMCLDVSVLFVFAIATSVSEGSNPQSLYEAVHRRSLEMQVSDTIINAIESANRKSWKNKLSEKHGWVLVSLQNALWQLLYASNFEEGIENTIGQGGSVRANAAVCGALLGSVYGIDAIPLRWQNAVINCEPDADNPSVEQPRPKEYWASDVMQLSNQLVAL